MSLKKSEKTFRVSDGSYNQLFACWMINKNSVLGFKIVY